MNKETLMHRIEGLHKEMHDTSKEINEAINTPGLKELQIGFIIGNKLDYITFLADQIHDMIHELNELK